jgi:hypothetical protein
MDKSGASAHMIGFVNVVLCFPEGFTWAERRFSPINPNKETI